MRSIGRSEVARRRGSIGAGGHGIAASGLDPAHRSTLAIKLALPGEASDTSPPACSASSRSTAAAIGLAQAIEQVGGDQAGQDALALRRSTAAAPADGGAGAPARRGRARTRGRARARCPARTRRASAGLPPAVDTATVRSPRRRIDGTMKLHQRGRSTTLSSTPAAVCLVGDRGVQRLVVGRRVGEQRAGQVARPVRPRRVLDLAARRQRRQPDGQRRTDHRHRGTCREQRSHLALRHLSAADHHAAPARDAQEDGVVLHRGDATTAILQSKRAESSPGHRAGGRRVAAGALCTLQPTPARSARRRHGGRGYGAQSRRAGQQRFANPSGGWY